MIKEIIIIKIKYKITTKGEICQKKKKKKKKKRKILKKKKKKKKKKKNFKLSNAQLILILYAWN